jgi:DNA-binding NarL/FixJ family response regulator
MVLAVENRDLTVRVLAVGDLEHDLAAFEALEGVEGVAVVGAVANPDAVAGVREVDVVVLGSTGERLGASIRRVRASLPEVRIVVLGRHDDAAVETAMGAGASGVVASPTPEALERALRRAAAGEIVLPAHHVAALVSRLETGRARSKPADVLTRLTAREREILRSLAGGRTPVEIGVELGISTLTVQTHLKSILAKLGVHSKIEAITLAWRDGLAPVPSSA